MRLMEDWIQKFLRQFMDMNFFEYEQNYDNLYVFNKIFKNIKSSKWLKLTMLKGSYTYFYNQWVL
jgi:hypothetical protein